MLSIFVDFLFLYIMCYNIYYHVTIQIKSLQRTKLAILYFLAIYYEEIPLSRGSNLALTKLLIAHLNPCQEERMFTTKCKSHSPTIKSIFGITQIITKAYQDTKFNQIILIRTISMSYIFTQPKMSGMCIRSHILIA